MGFAYFGREGPNGVGNKAMCWQRGVRGQWPIL
jgi:hypothetical protein